MASELGLATHVVSSYARLVIDAVDWDFNQIAHRSIYFMAFPCGLSTWTNLSSLTAWQLGSQSKCLKLARSSMRPCMNQSKPSGITSATLYW